MFIVTDLVSLNESTHAVLVLIEYASSDVLDEPAQTHSLARAFATRIIWA